MKTINVSEATPLQINWLVNWLVAKCGYITNVDCLGVAWVPSESEPHVSVPFQPATCWAQGGPIIDREGISTVKQDPPADNWWAFRKQQQPGDGFGPTPLVAAMRCYVSSKLGEVVEVPEELS